MEAKPAARETGFAAGNEVEDSGSCDGSKDLRDDVGQELRRCETFANDQADGNCGVQVAARDVADGEGHGEDGETEGESYSDEADSQIWEGRRKDCAATAAEDKPEGAEKLRCCTFREIHRGVYLRFLVIWISPDGKDNWSTGPCYWVELAPSSAIHA